MSDGYIGLFTTPEAYVPITTKINGKALGADVSLTADDVSDGTTYKRYSVTDKTRVAAVTADIATAQAAAVSTAATDATTKANTAETNAKNASRPVAWVPTADDVTDGATYKRYSATDKTRVAAVTADIATAQAAAVSTAATDATTKANTAETNAKNASRPVAWVPTADDVTDGTTYKRYSATDKTRVAAVTADIATAQAAAVSSAVSTAATDATTKANMAETNAKNASRPVAWVPTADDVTDGTTYKRYSATDKTRVAAVTADIATARAAAISTASADATTKANTAETNAKTASRPVAWVPTADDVTDGTTYKRYSATDKTRVAAVTADIATAQAAAVSSAVATAGTDATSKANTAESNAKAASRASTWVPSADEVTDGTTYKRYSATDRTRVAAVTADIATAQAAAVSSAATDATTKANTAETNAKTASRPVAWVPTADEVTDGTTYKRYSATDKTRVAAVTADIGTAQAAAVSSAVASAATDATTKANMAETNAKNASRSVAWVPTADEVAEGTTYKRYSATDKTRVAAVTADIAAAKSDAISTAATDATTKANAITPTTLGISGKLSKLGTDGTIAVANVTGATVVAVDAQQQLQINGVPQGNLVSDKAYGIADWDGLSDQVNAWIDGVYIRLGDCATDKGVIVAAADCAGSANALLGHSAGYAHADDVYAWAKASSKPSYNSTDVGLGNCNNTADSNKSVSYANTAGSAPANGGTSAACSGTALYANTAGSAPANGGTSSATNYVNAPDSANRATMYVPNALANSVRFQFGNGAVLGGTIGNYIGVMTYAPWDGNSASTGDCSYQLAFGSTVANGGNPRLAIRNGINTSWNSWKEIITAVNIGSQSVNYATSAGSCAVCSGNAASASSIAWTNVSGRPTALSSLTNDLNTFAVGASVTYGHALYVNGNVLIDGAITCTSSATSAFSGGITVGGSAVIHAGNIGSQSVLYATEAGTVQWADVSGVPTTLSSFTNNLGNYGEWLASGGTLASATITSINCTTLNGSSPITSGNIGSQTVSSAGTCTGNAVTATKAGMLNVSSNGIVTTTATNGTLVIITDNSSNWNTAYGWGNHASAGYVASSSVAASGANKILQLDASGYITTDNWIRIGTGTGLFNNGGNYFYPYNSDYWNIRSRSNAVTGIRFSYTNDTLRGFVYSDTNGFGLLNNQSGWSVRCNDGSSYGGMLYGTWYATGDLISNYSDARVKYDVQAIPSALELVRRMNGVTFKWNEKHADKNLWHTQHAGFIAQEIQEIVPSAIRDRGDGYMTLQYNEIMPYAVQAIKEVDEEVIELRAQVEELQARIARMN